MERESWAQGDGSSRPWEKKRACSPWGREAAPWKLGARLPAAGRHGSAGK
jgi:hypothetical protein